MMLTGWRYRVVSAAGTAALTIVAVLVANHPIPQELFTTYVPLFNRLDVTVLTGESLRLAIALSVAAVVGSLLPLYKPRPRRILDTVLLAEKRILVATLALATLGYFKWSHRLPRQTLVMTAIVLGITIPWVLVSISRRPDGEAERTLVVGNDPLAFEWLPEQFDGRLIGYVAPPTPYHTDTNTDRTARKAKVTDGGGPASEFSRLGGLSRLDDVIVEHDVDAAILTFDQADRAEFFGALHTCYDHGIGAKVHRKHLDYVLAEPRGAGPIVDIDLDPWDWQDRMIKRLFDVAFAGTALFVLSPVVFLIALAIKLEGHGPVFFSQKRTYRFGDTFHIYKFRTLKPEKGGEVGTIIDENRKTPLGEFLRRTHLDEIPQLWSILVGDMSVVGPRPAQTALESDFEEEANTWKQRWFVKPGLTGLAQINDATSQEPGKKIEYDLEYIRKQSLWLDLKIVIRQVCHVLVDVHHLIGDRN